MAFLFNFRRSIYSSYKIVSVIIRKLVKSIFQIKKFFEFGFFREVTRFKVLWTLGSLPLFCSYFSLVRTGKNLLQIYALKSQKNASNLPELCAGEQMLWKILHFTCTMPYLHTVQLNSHIHYLVCAYHSLTCYISSQVAHLRHNFENLQ